MNVERKTLHFSDAPSPSPDAGRVERAVAESRRALQAAPARRLAALWILRAQLTYMGAGFWLGSAGILWAAALLPAPRDMIFAFTGPALAALSAPALARSRAAGMWELERSALCPLPRLVAARLLIAGSGDLAALALLLAPSRASLVGAARLLLPFLCSCALVYLLLGRWPGRPGAAAGAVACLGVGPVFLRSGWMFWPPGAVWAAAASCAALTVALAVRLARKSNEEARKWSL